MKQYALFALAALLSLFVACQQNSSPSSDNAHFKNSLSLAAHAEDILQYERLQLYPIVAAAGTQQNLPNLKDVATAMQLPGFRITERKKFGDGSEAWYHGLTVQNKTNDTIYMMSGDVVTGGNQDRVIAYDDVLLPRTLKNIEVFCVEKGRSQYYDQTANAAEQEVAAFKGYYSVASPGVRRAVHGGQQEKVWGAVAKVTDANDATSETHTYAALAAAENAKQTKRNEYLQHLSNAWAERADVVGVVAVCAGRVVAVDIFGNTPLFRQRYPNLLQGYVAEVMLDTPSETADSQPTAVQVAFERVSQLADLTKPVHNEAARFVLNGQWIHLYQK